MADDDSDFDRWLADAAAAADVENMFAEQLLAEFPPRPRYGTIVHADGSTTLLVFHPGRRRDTFVARRADTLARYRLQLGDTIQMTSPPSWQRLRFKLPVLVTVLSGLLQLVAGLAVYVALLVVGLRILTATAGPVVSDAAAITVLAAAAAVALLWTRCVTVQPARRVAYLLIAGTNLPAAGLGRHPRRREGPPR